MKITTNGVTLFVVIERARKEKRGQRCSIEQLNLTPKMVSLKRFVEIFPLEDGVEEQLVVFARSLDKVNIDQKTVALFFGGDEWALRVNADLKAKGFNNGMAMSLLLFRLLLPVKIKKEKKGEGYSGFYFNQGVEVDFTHLQLLCDDEKVLEAGPMFFIRHGYIISSCEKNIYGPVLEEQSTSSLVYGACARMRKVDCRNILSPYHFVSKKGVL